MKGDELKKLKVDLKRRGWTQELIAASLNRSQPHISFVLAGSRESRSLLGQLKTLSRRDAPRGEAAP
jgi:transcriptional regulator with XRE-family HTH domain